MNPCPKNKRPIAWMAAGILEPADAERLREHLQTCPGCQRYWESMRALSEQLSSAELPQAELTESFHRRLVRKIDEHDEAAPLFVLVGTFRRLWGERRLATIAAGVAFVIAALVWMQSFSRDENHMPARVRVENSEPSSQNNSPPTLASYHRAADISFENLDAVLAKQAASKPSTVETFTVSSLLTRSLED